MLTDLKGHIKEKLPFLIKKKLLVAVSGGVDSIVLSHLLYTLNFEVSLAHCNFKLRGKDSDEDEDFVKSFAKKLGIDSFTISFDTKNYALENKLSTQIAARELRYEWFDCLVIENDFDYIVTAHHADDNLETFLINLTRGTGLDGLIGIPEVNGKIVRPLLTFSREDILKYAKEHSIEWREDYTNQEVKYVRNKIRHQIVPVLKEINPNILKTFDKVSGFLSESKQIIDDRIEEVSAKILEKEEEIYKIDIAKVLKLSNSKAYLYQVLKDFGFTEWTNVSDLLQAETGKFIESKTHVLLRNRESLLVLDKEKEANTTDRFEIGLGRNKIDIHTTIHVEKYLKTQVLSKKCILVNKNLVTFPMILRKWEEGDFFYPTGMKGKKKVSKFFKDEKMSKFSKEKTWLLCTQQNQVVWIVGKRQDRRFVPTDLDSNIIKVNI
ncbi:tRNA lysidine(34) synthetase TilS [Tenacibaculum agarivorans]|uniref:tRNA lysidine(34) synthetase TilS n=1 Tax=Tenacibaculum agarivorans TaxID=1908389 RepID=UPI00094BC397|nr:tRNA lysidine(34) synthetase TilS [Tenacibaculum agarivorans]